MKQNVKSKIIHWITVVAILFIVIGIILSIFSSLNIFCIKEWFQANEVLKIWTPLLSAINILVLIALNVFVRDSAKQGVEKQIEIQKQVCLFKYKYELFFKHRKIIHAKYYNMMEDPHSEKIDNGSSNENVFDEFKNAMYNCCQDFLNLLPAFQKEPIYDYWMRKIDEYTDRYRTKPVIEFSEYSSETSPKLYEFCNVLENHILNFEL